MEVFYEVSKEFYFGGYFAFDDDDVIFGAPILCAANYQN
ncbi:hypothetical protein THER_0035 [Thermodesulfovibrio sp. N1]|nr:hypothetical protein THER_0035 [Thermodesulfovibrio sp. N1]